MPERRIYALLYEQDTCEFNTADRLISHIDVRLWRNNPSLLEVYLSCNLSEDKTSRKITVGERRCEAAGCSKMFTPDARGMRQAKFCSKACKGREYRKNRAAREKKKARYGTRYDTCPNGHDRSPENTYVHPNGQRIQCRVCRREALQEKARTDETYRRAMRDKERRRRAERASEINARRRELYAAKRAVAA